MSACNPSALWRVIVVDATSGIPLVAGSIGVVAALLSGSVITGSMLLPGWADPSNAVLSTCLVMCPFATGLAATHAIWLRRSGLSDLAITAPDGLWRAQGVAAVTSGIWALLAYACLTAMVLLASDLRGPFAPSMLLLIAQGAVLMVAGSTLGSLAGTAVPRTWMAPLMATLTFIVLNVLDRADGALDRYSMTFTFVFYQNNLVPNATLLVGAILLATAVGVSACAVLRAISNWRRALPWGVLVSVLVSGGVVATQLAPAGDVEFRTSGAAACADGSTVQLCVFSESSPQLRRMIVALEDARAAALPVLGDVPQAFREPLVPSSLAGPVSVSIPPNSERFGYLGRAVEAIVPAGSCSPLIAERDDLMGLVYERLQADSVDSDEVRRVAKLSLAEQIAWAQPRLERLEKCQ